MNSRNYDNVPPLASNTVTIATSSTSQIRLPPSGQIRPLASVPIRQSIPIRKMVHDSGGTPTSGNLSTVQYPMIPIKEEVPDTQDYQSASTSSGPLIAPTASNSFQQYQRGGPSGSGTSGTIVINNGINSMAMDQPAPVNLASKVAEVFLTAGHAFQKLGDLTLQLHTTTDADESKWSEKEVDNLKNALTRFAHELDQISTCVASRTTKHIKNDIKRRHMLAEESPQQAKRMAMSGNQVPSGSGAYSAMTPTGMISSGHAVPLGQKRTGGPPMKQMVTTRTVIPTGRYTVAAIPSTSNYIPTSTVVVNSSQSPSPVGMPQLQSQGGPGPSSSSGASRIITASSPATTLTRVIAPQQMLQGAVKGTKRIMTPTSGAMSIPSSGALVLEQNE